MKRDHSRGPGGANGADVVSPQACVRSAGGRHRAGLTQLNISGREFAVLTLIESEGPASQQRLADRVGVDRTTMVALVDALEEKGWSPPQGSQQSARLLLQTTEAGRKRLRDTLKAVKKAEQEILAPLSSAESATLTRLLQCLVQAQPPRT